MSGSRTIRVLKREGSVEFLDSQKLAASMWRAMRETHASFDHARQLAEAIKTYLSRRVGGCVSSSAIFEMTVKAFRHVGLDAAAEAAEAYQTWRNIGRTQLRIRHEGERLTYWDKEWLCEFAARSWHVSHAAARMLAGRVELQLLQQGHKVIARQAVINLLNRLVSEYGLADAVPVRH